MLSVSKLCFLLPALFCINGLFAATNYSDSEIAEHLEKSDVYWVVYDENEVILSLDSYKELDASIKKRQGEYEKEMGEIQNKLRVINEKLVNTKSTLSMSEKKKEEENFNNYVNLGKSLEMKYNADMKQLESDGVLKINEEKKAVVAKRCRKIAEKLRKINGKTEVHVIAISNGVAVGEPAIINKRDITHLIISDLGSRGNSKVVKNRGRR